MARAARRAARHARRRRRLDKIQSANVSCRQVSGKECRRIGERAFRAINLVDATKHGFRILLRDEFLREHLAPTLLPT